MNYKFKDLLVESTHSHLYEITRRFDHIKRKIVKTRDIIVIDNHRYTILDKIREEK